MKILLDPTAELITSGEKEPLTHSKRDTAANSPLVVYHSYGAKPTPPTSSK